MTDWHWRKNEYSKHVTGGNLISKWGKINEIESQLYSIYEKQFQVD